MTSKSPKPDHTQMPMGPAANVRRRPTVLATVLLTALFIAGALHWILFLHHGDLSFKAHDWGKEYIYYSLFRQAISAGQIPYHISVAFHGTNRFLALPETNLSPQILLLLTMDVGKFILTNVLLLYTLGFIGCLWLRRRYHLSSVPFLILFILFNFNGHITAHIGVGHSMWCAYFLLPFFFLFTLEMVEGRYDRMTPMKLGLVMFGIVLQGGLHVYLWCVTLLVLLVVFNRRYLKPIGLSII